MPAVERQKGFVFLLVIVVIAIIASLWLSTKHSTIVSLFKNESIENDFGQLQRAKERLLAYAVLHPETYMTDASGDERDAGSMPSPGYFPCPDLAEVDPSDSSKYGLLDPNVGSPDNETNCGISLWDSANPTTTGFSPAPGRNSGVGLCDGTQPACLGYLPRKIDSRDFYFAPPKRYFYFVDSRYVSSNPTHFHSPDYANRFAPLNPAQLDPNLVSNPGLTLNGQSGYVVILIDPGADGQLDAENANGDSLFVANVSTLSTHDQLDKAVGITYDEWFWWMGQRICKEYPRLSAIDENRAHWFNNYRSSSDPNPNPVGGDWRTWGGVCN